MCGIAGFVGKSGALSASALESMAQALVHRGPNDSGFWGRSPEGKESRWHHPGEGTGSLAIGFGFRRLSILDLSPTGAQPMTSADGRYVMVFNGQIYNYVELRRELRDIPFKSTGDSEVLVNGFARWGLDALTKFQGIFAFAMHDRQTRKTWLVRDPLGVKPLYYRETSDGLFFGSEIRALLAVEKEKPRLRRELLGRYLMCNWVPDPDTLFEGIFKLEPGHFLEIDPQGRVKDVKYWDFDFSPDEGRDLESWADALREALGEVVTRQMRSDVPLGFFLSGGVDSSLLTAEAALRPGAQVGTFTTGFRWGKGGEESEDMVSARSLRGRLPLDYNEILLEPSIVSLLPKVVACLEEPIADPAALCSYLICEAAVKRFTVLISGQGGDELFGGYPVYQAGWLGGAVGRLPGPLKALAFGASTQIPYSVGGREVQSVHRLQKILGASRAPWPETFCLLRSPLRADQGEQLVAEGLRPLQQPPFARHEVLFEKARGWDRLHQMLYLDAKTYLPALNLTYSDKTSMAHSVELRVPLLDPQIVRLVERVPSRYKVTPREGKVLLKRVAEEKLPVSLVRRRKQGFGLPLQQWFLDELQPMARDLLSPDRLRRGGWIDPQLPGQWLEEHAAKKADHCMKLYSLMTLELWRDAFGVT